MNSQHRRQMRAARERDYIAWAPDDPEPWVMPNQCDGCAAGMPVNDWGHHVGPDGRPHMGCTRERYMPGPPDGVSKPQPKIDTSAGCVESNPESGHV